MRSATTTALFCALLPAPVRSLQSQSPSFHGNILCHSRIRRRAGPSTGISGLVMRKQKASDRRTRRLQKGESLISSSSNAPPFSSQMTTLTSPPMSGASWRHKTAESRYPPLSTNTRGRGRARKRTEYYASLSAYHSKFMNLLTEEYRAEENEVMARLDASFEDPLSLEMSGHALFDLYPERRGDIFVDEVYRLYKAKDATTTGCAESLESNGRRNHVPKHKFRTSDIILLTLQPRGSGDYFDASNLPFQPDATSIEARVLSVGPGYIDVCVRGGLFESSFGPAPNNVGPTGRGDAAMRLRADRFFSSVPYTRMVEAVSKLTTVTDSSAIERSSSRILDPLLRELILSTYGYVDPLSPSYKDSTACDVISLSNRLGRAPFSSSKFFANQVLTAIQKNTVGQFKTFNESQFAAIAASQTRRLTLIQGPPGTGKTTVAGAIMLGFAFQCRNLSPNAKTLACAFSNVGADNLCTEAKNLGLKVIRIGSTSSVSKSLWSDTLDAAIARDAKAVTALEEAKRVTALLRQITQKKSPTTANQKRKYDIFGERSARDAATLAVKASIEACRVAAARALRDADVIVTTSVGAADARLLAACGIATQETQNFDRSKTRQGLSTSESHERSYKQRNAPDGRPALFLPFTIIDEACQSVEPADLIPITASDSCRALVMLGDPCQLPPTVRTDLSRNGTGSPLSLSLMERLSQILPNPVRNTMKAINIDIDERYLDSRPIRRTIALVRRRSLECNDRCSHMFGGSLFLSVQYRMHPSISAFPSAAFYDGMLTTPKNIAEIVESRVQLNSCLPIEDPHVNVRFIDVGGRNNEARNDMGYSSSYMKASQPSHLVDITSFRNEAEAHQVVICLTNILKTRKEIGTAPISIGVVTPYTAQLSLLNSIVAADVGLAEMSKGVISVIEIETVDAYQGREMDIIIFSAVRSNRYGNLGFLSDWRRMNVALTRAKSGLIVIGDLATLRAGGSYWEAFIIWCEEVKCGTVAM